jgi:hypothetical protein
LGESTAGVIGDGVLVERFLERAVTLEAIAAMAVGRGEAWKEERDNKGDSRELHCAVWRDQHDFL